MNETALVEKVALALWHRFAHDDRISWDDETHKAEYRHAAAEVVALVKTQEAA